MSGATGVTAATIAQGAPYHATPLPRCPDPASVVLTVPQLPPIPDGSADGLPAGPAATTRRRLLLAAAAGFAGARGAAAQPAAPTSGARTVRPRGPLGADEQNTVTLFRDVSPSVVHITTLELSRDLFSTAVHETPRGTGSGFIWDELGHVVTNFHVIEGGHGASVTLADQTRHPASLVGVFPERDLAVLRIPAQRGQLQPIAIGRSGDLQVGQHVLAIGNPFGLDQTLTTGVVSALNREIESMNRRSIRGVIQTDAAINPGNSGGPLLDSAGRLIGVNTSIYSPSGASAGIGFAIPVDEVNRVVPRLIRDGRFVRPTIGVVPAPDAMTRALRLPAGVPILRLLPGSPAQRAGLVAFARRRDGGIVVPDVITAIDGQPLRRFDDLMAELENRNPGGSAVFTIWREGRSLQLRLELDEEG